MRHPVCLALIPLLLALPTGAAAAQTPDTAEASRGFGWFFSVGAQRAAWDDLSAAFRDAGYAEPAREQLAIGGGGYVTRGRLLLGGEGYGVLGDATTSSGGQEVRAGGGAGFFTVGYLVVDQPTTRAYPLLGIGGQGLTLRIDDPGGVGIGPEFNNPTFGQVLDNPGFQADLRTGGLAFSLGAGLDVLVGMRRREARRREYGFLVGLRGGYQWTPVRDDWRLYRQKVIGGPDDIHGGWFLRLSLGGGGRRWRAARG